MEIQQLRKEFNQLLDKITQQSERFTDEVHLPSLEVSVMISKINKLQEVAAVLKYATEHMEDKANQKRRSYDAQLNEERVEESNQEEKKEVRVSVEEEVVVESTIIEVNGDETVSVIQEVEESEIPENSSVGDKFLHTPIKSLKDAFSLNDRYLFANELFNKDMSLFNDTLKLIDGCTSHDEALLIFEKKRTELNWDTEGEYFLLFQNKVQRRFLS